MQKTVRGLAIIALVATAVSRPASADDLIMPYACAYDGSGIRLTPSNDVAYRLVGPRDEKPFSVCRGAGQKHCETMMIHKFAIACRGHSVPWSHIAAAAHQVGIEMPAALPPGYAPVSRLSGRFVLPSLARSQPARNQVATQDLLPTSVIETYEPRPLLHAASWQTIVSVDGPGDGADGSPDGAFKFAGALTTVVALLLAASLMIAGSRRTLIFAFSSAVRRRADAPNRFASGAAASAFARTSQAFRHNKQARHESRNTGSGDDSVANGLAVVYTRTAETEKRIAQLPEALLLRDVLQTEIETIRTRADDLSRRANRMLSQKAAAMIRGLLRDVDRVGRIAHGAAAQGSMAENEGNALRMPHTASEAYRLLGLTADAPPAAVKKMIDALRMTWHPDHARDEADRQSREERMKQINAAWDLIKARKAAA